MSETPESGIGSAPEVTESSRLRRALTWVGIVAGAVFIVGAIFVAGAATGWLPPGTITMGRKRFPCRRKVNRR